MVKEFNLTKENAKEYFFLNQCRLMYIDHGDWTNADKFRSYGFDEITLDQWTNEWLALKLNKSISEIDTCELYSIVTDLGYRINFENAEKLISIYYDLQNTITDEKKIALLFRYEFSAVLDKYFYYGLIFIAVKNKMLNHLNRLINNLKSLLEAKPLKIKEEYNKYLKKLCKKYSISFK